MHALKACGSSVASCGLRRSVGVAPRPGSSMVCAAMQAPQTSARHEPACAQSSVTAETTSTSYGAFVSSFALYLLSAAPALASGAESYNPFEGAASNSLYVTLALFLMSVPGIWSQIKRAPKANIKRKTFEVEGPKAPNAMPLDDRARQIFKYVALSAQPTLRGSSSHGIYTLLIMWRSCHASPHTLHATTYTLVQPRHCLLHSSHIA